MSSVVPAGNAVASQQPAGLVVPGGYASFAQALNVSATLPRARVMLAAIRILWEVPEGANPAADRRRAAILEYLRAADQGAAARPPAPGEDVPGFLPADAWTGLLREIGTAGASPFTAILQNRRAALLYHGVAALDTETRDYLGGNPKLLEAISREDRVAIFATFGRSFHVRGGRVEPPGGAEAAPLWEATAGETLAEPDAFIPRALDRNGGRFALLYDGLAHMEEPARRFALGLRFTPARRIERFQTFYEAAAAPLRTWQPQQRPFDRVPFDAVHLLLSTRFAADGQLAGPAWPPLWRAVFDPFVDPETALASLGNEDLCDAAKMLEIVGVADSGERERRARTWLLAQRIFRRPTRQSARDLLPTLKAVARYPSLFVTLERMGIEALPTYVAAVQAADRLDSADRRLWLFQASLAILERVRAARAVDAATADALVRVLCAATPEGGDPYRGAIARWIERDLLAAAGRPVLPPDLTATDRPVETHLLAAMAGSVASLANTNLLALPPIEWEGLTYRLDPGVSTLRRVVAVRARQGGPSLDGVLVVARLADAMASAASRDAAIAAAEQLPAAAAALREQASEGRRRVSVAGDDPDLDRLVARAADEAKRLKPNDPKAAASLARPLQEAVDSYLAEVLGAIVYAPHLGEPDSPALLAGDPSAVHDFRFFQPAMELGRRPAWQVPVEVRDRQVAWGVSGSLVNLDAAIGRLLLRRAFTETLPPPPALSDPERQTVTEAAVLATPHDSTEAARESLLAAVQRGRQRVEALGVPPDEIDRLAADVELDEWRRQALAWTVANEPARRLEFLSLGELARAGGLDALRQAGIDAWGTSEFARDGALVARYPVRLEWTTIAGRRGVRAVASLVPDLAIGLAERSRQMGLPAALTPGLLLVATQRFIETAQTAHADDWLTLVSHARSVARDGIEDYVAALTVSGPLVTDPLTESGPADPTPIRED